VITILIIAACMLGGQLYGARYYDKTRTPSDFMRRWRDRVRPSLRLIQGGKS
jgi:hypothetical protein